MTAPIYGVLSLDPSLYSPLDWSKAVLPTLLTRDGITLCGQRGTSEVNGLKLTPCTSPNLQRTPASARACVARAFLPGSVALHMGHRGQDVRIEVKE